MANELELRIKALAETVATDIKTLFAQDGMLSTLTTTDKTSLVSALNELVVLIGSKGVGDMLLATVQNITALKTFNTGTVAFRNPANTFSYNLLGSAITANRTATLPLLTANDIFVFAAFAQTLTNKTLSNALNTVTAPAVTTVGYLGIPQNTQSAAYTLVLADAGKHILHPSADTTARIFTIPANASVAFPIGTAVTFINQNGGGAITIAITTDTMRLAGAGTTGSRTLAANGIATAIKVTATEWLINGTNLT